MAYEKLTLVENTTPLNKALIEHIENGIVANEKAIANLAANSGGGASGGTALSAVNYFANGDFADSTDWTVLSGGTLTVADNMASVYHEGVTGTVCGVQQSVSLGDRGQKTGDVWFMKAHVDVTQYLVGDVLNYPVVQLMANSAGGLLYACNTEADELSGDYYGTVTATADSAAKMNTYLRVQYSKTERAAGMTCKFGKALFLNLTEIFGAGNEPTADEMYQLLSAYDGHWFGGTANLSANSVYQRYFLNLAPVTKDCIVTVGAAGDFTSFREALEYLSTKYPAFKNKGLNCEVRILDGTIINEQIWLERIDLSHISITTDAADNTVKVDVTGWIGVTHDTRGNRPFLSAEYGARLPCIKCLFSCIVPDGGWNSDNYAVGYFCNRGSTGVIAGEATYNGSEATGVQNIGFENFYDNIIANNNSEIVAREAVARNAGRYGVLSRHISRVSARSADITNCSDTAVYADRVSLIDARYADLSGSKIGISAEHASTITANQTIANNIALVAVKSEYGSLVNCNLIAIDGAVDVFQVVGGATIITHGAQLSNITGTEKNVDMNVITSNGIIYG